MRHQHNPFINHVITRPKHKNVAGPSYFYAFFSRSA